MFPEIDEFTGEAYDARLHIWFDSYQKYYDFYADRADVARSSIFIDDPIPTYKGGDKNEKDDTQN